MDVCIDNAIELDLRQTALRVVEEVQAVVPLDLVEVRVVHVHVRDQFSVQRVVRRNQIPVCLDNLLRAQVVVVVLEGYRCAFGSHALELPPSLPLIRPRAVVERVTNGVVGNGLAIVSGQLVLPVAVAVSVRNGLQ